MDTIVYDNKNISKEYFEDNHEDSNIYDYFKNVKADIPQHLKYLVIEIIIEFIIIYFLVKKRNNTNC